jgi:hypothetical protein
MYKGKYKLQKASLGIQKVSVPPEMSGAEQFTGIAGMTMQGAQLGSNFGPIGTVVGGGLGLIGGSIGTAINAKQAREANEAAMKYNQSVDRDNLMLGAVEQTQIRPTLYADGANKLTKENKLIELERKETVFERNEDGKFHLVLEVKGKTHNQGGEIYNAKRGQVIFPAEKYEEVMQAWKDRNHAKLETMRMALPKDKNPTTNYFNEMDKMGMEAVPQYAPVDMAKKGKRYVLPKYQTGARQIGDPELLNTTPPSYAPYAWGTAVPSPSNDNSIDITTPNLTNWQLSTIQDPYNPNINIDPSLFPQQSLPPQQTSRQPFNLNLNQNQLLGVVGQAPNIYNTVRGFLERPQVNQPILPNMEQMDFRDRYNPQRRLVMENRNITNQRLSALGAGNAAVVGANQAIINATATNQLNDINNQAANEAFAVDQTNLGLRNQWEQNAANEYRRIQEINDMNKAAQTRFQAAGMSGVGQSAYDQIAYNQGASRDQAMNEAQKNYITQMAQRDRQSAYLMFLDKPDALEYFSEEELSQIFGSDPQMVQGLLTMKANVNKITPTQPMVINTLPSQRPNIPMNINTDFLNF